MADLNSLSSNWKWAEIQPTHLASMAQISVALKWLHLLTCFPITHQSWCILPSAPTLQLSLICCPSVYCLFSVVFQFVHSFWWQLDLVMSLAQCNHFLTPQAVSATATLIISLRVALTIPLQVIVLCVNKDGPCRMFKIQVSGNQNRCLWAVASFLSLFLPLEP